MEDARREAAADRVKLAARFLSAAKAAYTTGLYRDAVSRAYYAAYHAMRAATFLATGGDDHEKHSDLPNNLPEGLADPVGTKNGLTAARLARNGADYDPYPKTEPAWRIEAETTLAFAQQALKDARSYIAHG